MVLTIRSQRLKYRLVSNGSGTVAVWVKLNSKPSFANIASENSSTNPLDHTFQLDYRGDAVDRFRMIIFDGSSAKIVTANSFGSPSVGVWQLLMCCWDGANISIKVNSGSTDTAVAGSINSVASATLGVGNQPNFSRFFGGRLDSLAIWDRVLTAAEISSWYASGRNYTGDTVNQTRRRRHVSGAGVL